MYEADYIEELEILKIEYLHSFYICFIDQPIYRGDFTHDRTLYSFTVKGRETKPRTLESPFNLEDIKKRNIIGIIDVEIDGADFAVNAKQLSKVLTDSKGILKVARYKRGLDLDDGVVSEITKGQVK